MRLAGQEKMGYYPTPEPIARQIGHLLTSASSGRLRALDPCCGEGTALHLAVEGLDAPLDTYGVELDRDRAAAARGLLHTILHADIRHLRASNQAFGLLWLNPPYDWDTATEDDIPTERLELIFLRETLRYLQPAGILVYLIPQHRLTSTIAKTLAYQFEHIQTFRFPDSSYQAYQQIVLLGVKKHVPYREHTIAAHLEALGHGLIQPPPLPNTHSPTYLIPDAPLNQQFLFQSVIIDPRDLLEEVERHGALPLLLARTTPNTHTQLRPMMPLRKGHLALILASGHLNNEIVTDAATGERLLVKGNVTKETVKSETTEDDSTVLTERDVLTITITTLDLETGHIQVLQ